jgi:hypothetical protein
MVPHHHVQILQELVVLRHHRNKITSHLLLREVEGLMRLLPMRWIHPKDHPPLVLHLHHELAERRL